MEDKELIFRLQQLKQIRPRENWVVFNKSKIFGIPLQKNSLYNRIISVFSNISLQRKLSYAFATLLFVLGGLIGTDILVQPNFSKQPAAIFKPDVSIKSFQEKSDDLAKAVQNYKSESVNVDEVKVAAKSLTDEINSNPGIAKEVAVELKNSGTLASLDGGTELKAASGDLYKTIDSQMIEDLEKATLTEDNQAILEQAKELFNKGEYSKALEQILLINS